MDIFDYSKNRSIGLGVYSDSTMIAVNGPNNQTVITDTGIQTPTLTQTSIEKEKKNFEKLEKRIEVLENGK